MRRFAAAVALCVGAAIPSPCLAVAKPGRGGAFFLRVPTGARATAMGETFVAAADDAETLSWNPAGLAPLRNPFLQLDHLFYFDETRIDAAAVTFPTLWGGFGIGTRWFTGPDLPRIRDGVEAGQFSVVERAGEAAFAVGKRNFSVGVTGRYFQSVLDRRSVDAIMADAGVLKRWKKDRYRLGFAALNMGSPFGLGATADLKAPPPRMWRSGFAYRGDTFLFSLEHQKPQNLQSRYHAGVEYRAMPGLSMRFGYVLLPRRERNSLDPLAQWRFGGGARIAGISADYAFTPSGPLGDLHQVSLAWRFGFTQLEEAGRISFEADPLFFSPNGDGRNDAAFLIFGNQGIMNISRWLMEVRTQQGAVAWRKTARGAPPGLTEWAGVDDAGKPLDEGDYLLQARAWSPQYQALSPVRHVVIDVTPPQVELDMSTTAFSPDGDGVNDSLLFEIRARDRNGLARWTLDVFSTDDPANAVYSSSGSFASGLSTAAWMGQAQRTGATAGNGFYTARVAVSDRAGNELSLTGPQVELAADAETVVKRLPSSFQTQKTADGYRVVLRSEQVFESASSPLVSSASDPLRSQLLALAKAFPDHRLVINGRVGSEKKADRRTELSSAQAWAFYSALVKAGVSPRRLEVHGLGGAAGENNRIEVMLVKPPAPAPEAAPPAAP